MTNAIEFTGVHRHFGEQAVLRGLELAVQPGEVYALLGRNGAGKTTAIQILLGFLEPIAGSTRVLGLDSRTLQPADRERIGYVAEDHHVADYRDVQTTLAYEAATRSRFDAAYASQMLARFELPGATKVSKLSRGQRAQLALALAIAGRPEVLVFDDPGLGLDAVARRDLLEAMIDLLVEAGTTVFFSSHALADVERLADRVGILHDGALVADVAVEDLRRRVESRRFLWTGAPPERFEATGRPEVLACRRDSDGLDLLLVDFDPAAASWLPAGGRLTEPRPATLEDVFVGLTDHPTVNVEVSA